MSESWSAVRRAGRAVVVLVAAGLVGSVMVAVAPSASASSSGGPSASDVGAAEVSRASTGVDLLSVRMSTTNVLDEKCRDYPVKYWVKNTEDEWPGYVVGWRLQLTLVNPSHLGEGGDRLLIKGTGNKAGTATFRMCGLKHSAGRFEARGAIASWPYTDSMCNPVPPPTSAAGVDRACDFSPELGRDRDTFSASFKRPTRITLAGFANGCHVAVARGRVLAMNDQGRCAPASMIRVVLRGNEWEREGGPRSSWPVMGSDSTNSDGRFWWRGDFEYGPVYATANSSWRTLPSVSQVKIFSPICAD